VRSQERTRTQARGPRRAVKMMRCAVKGGGVGVVGGGQRSASGFGSRSVVRMPEDRGLCCGVRSRAADLAGVEMGRPNAGAVFRSPRYGRVRATAGGASFVAPVKRSLVGGLQGMCGSPIWGWLLGLAASSGMATPESPIDSAWECDGGGSCVQCCVGYQFCWGNCWKQG
jgi:hypothetical protein